MAWWQGGEEKKKKSKVRRRGNYHIAPAFVAWRHCQHISSRLRLNNKLRMLTTLCSCSASKSIHKIHRYIYIFISSCGALKIGQRPVEFNDWKMRHLSWVPASFPHPSSLPPLFEHCPKTNVPSHHLDIYGPTVCVRVCVSVCVLVCLGLRLAIAICGCKACQFVGLYIKRCD